MKTFKKDSKKIRGISPVVSTIIISATLLIILVIASFVATNMLELQIANTEFEQAKTNMLLLDEVIQDVALRRNAGGYVQFNQRSGGINIIQNTETLKILGPPQRKSGTLTLRPNAAGTYQNWMPYGDGNAHHDRTSDQNDITGVQITGDESKKETLNLEDASQTGTINNVTAYIRAKADGTGQGEGAALIWKLGSSEVEAIATIIARSGFNVYSATRTTDPADGNWDWADINNLEIGARATQLGKGETIQVSEFWIEVNYTVEERELNSGSDSKPLYSLVYRGGSKVSGADMILRGSDSLNVNLAGTLGYLRIKTGHGVQIILDYNRVRIIKAGVIVLGNTTASLIEITFIRLEKGSIIGSSDTVNVKVQNKNVNTITHIYDTSDKSITFEIKLGDSISPPITFTVECDKTVVLFTEILVEISIG
jgi:hypothetical protein